MKKFGGIIALLVLISAAGSCNDNSVDSSAETEIIEVQNDTESENVETEIVETEIVEKQEEAEINQEEEKSENSDKSVIDNQKSEDVNNTVSNNQENDNESYNEVQSTSYQENADNNTNNSSSNNDSSTSNDSSSVTVPQAEEIVENSVWVPVNGGTKYHSKAGCSNMIDPVQVSEETAIANGYEPCKRCY